MISWLQGRSSLVEEHGGDSSPSHGSQREPSRGPAERALCSREPRGDTPHPSASTSERETFREVSDPHHSAKASKIGRAESSKGQLAQQIQFYRSLKGFKMSF